LFVFLEGAAVNPGRLRSRVLSSSSLLSCISLWGGAAVPLGRNPRILGRLPPSLSPSPLQDVSLFFVTEGAAVSPGGWEVLLFELMSSRRDNQNK